MPRVAPNIPLASIQPPQTSPLAGIVLILASVFALATLDASGKWVMAAGIPLLVFCWFRYLVHLLLMICVAAPARGPSVFRTQHTKLQILRAFAMLCATLLFFTTLKYLHQAEATAIIFVSPLLMLAIAPWLLKEPPKRSRWFAAGCGLLGVLIVIRPSAGLDSAGVIAGLLTACLFAGQHLLTRMVASDNAYTTSIWSSGIGTLALTVALPWTLPPALPMLSELDVSYWLLMLSTGLTGGTGHVLQSMAYRKAPASTLAPFIYMQMIAAVTMGWLFWGHFPDGITWIGIAIICASGVLNSLNEWKQNRR